MRNGLRQLQPGLFNSQAASRASCGVGLLVNLTAGPQHQVIEDGFQILANLDHRGARGAEENTGDGAGMLLQKPQHFFQSEVSGLGDSKGYAVGQLFMPRNKGLRHRLIQHIENLAQQYGFAVHAWRTVPTNNAGLGGAALQAEPIVMQCFVRPKDKLISLKFDARLYLLRHIIEKSIHQRIKNTGEQFYICSFHRQKIVYKGLLTATQLKIYYPELSDKRVASSFALVHSRFSTNTLGAWSLAHPYRCSVHNGEINTLRGNFNAMLARQHDLYSERFGDDIEHIIPITYEGQSDTAVLDNVLELLIESGRSLPHALRMLIPEAWQKDRSMNLSRRAFYEYHAHLMEPWDGPALVIASDGYSVAAILDRNGLRPCRYYLTRDDRLIMASETGVLDVPQENIRLKGRLHPGELLLADTVKQRLLYSDEIFQQLDCAQYKTWLDGSRLNIDDVCRNINIEIENEHTDYRIEQYQRVFDYSTESLRCLVQPMAEFGKDPIGSMGSDTPIAALSSRNKSLFQYFSQLFAQVSNPPLDYIREELVTSLQCPVGKKLNLLTESAAHCRQLILNSPILSAAEMAGLRDINHHAMRSVVIDISFDLAMTLQQAIEQLQAHVVSTIADGFEFIILTDRNTSKQRLPMPSLLATSAVHHELIRKGLRNHAAIIVDFAQPHTVHHYCTLLGYGADAIHPWLAYRSIQQMIEKNALSKSLSNALQQYRRAVEGGILKVMSKMGISTLASYKGAQVFEIVGLNQDLVDDYFYGTPAHLPGVSLQQLENELRGKHQQAFVQNIAGNLELEQGGELYWRRDGEVHHWNPYTIGRLQRAVIMADQGAYDEFSAYSNEQNEQLHTLRGLLKFNGQKKDAINIDEVESAAQIVKRFSTSSMSFGALSQEAHETLAVAMNRVGGKSGTGEGGEQVDRYTTERECSIKQVASGRFGVDINYLCHAQEIEIKMAQGSKPGEGGELPENKVDEGIASVRFTVPGVGLISPPPHHDIYSIEDLAQLIHDLKCANPQADIHVKLVAEQGVGTIAAGVCKARADVLLISGDSGGTGASVKTSIKSAGCAWELGLAETQQVLLANNLRSRIRIRVDGGLRTGRDVVIAALLGAEEFGFGTAPLVALGCIMLRKCHCNTCSVGIATQDPKLRQRFSGKPEHVINYMLFVAREVRALMAELGFRKFDDMVGQVEKLIQTSVVSGKGVQLDLSQLLYRQPSNDSLYKTKSQNHKLEQQLDQKFIVAVQEKIDRGEIDRHHPVILNTLIHNRDRSVGTLLSSVITRQCTLSALDDDSIRILCTGTAGQSFGAFLARGISLHLQGDANDYVGKGLSGGKIIIRVPAAASYIAAQNIIIGNVALYGATRGELYVNGVAGERFAVRNSGAICVVEGVGNHACEYMTGGVVVIIGETGYNFAAGMSGGEVFVFDEKGDFKNKLNTAMVHLEACEDQRDVDMILRFLENHQHYTCSAKAKIILHNWSMLRSKFVKVIAASYAKVIDKNLQQGTDIRPLMPPLVLRNIRTDKTISRWIANE
jgi:glutamate synthase (NADPH/NADH) large chain